MYKSTQPAQYYAGTYFKIWGNPKTQPVLLMIHGVGLNHTLWTPWLPILQNTHCVITYDLLGHGGTVNPPNPRNAADFIQQLQGILDYLEIGRFSLLGFSLGAIIAQAYTYTHPLRLDELILLHSVHKRTEQQRCEVRKRYQITAHDGPMATVELAIERWFSTQYVQDNPEIIQALRDTFSQHKDNGYLKAYYFFTHAETEMQNYPIEGISCPTLIITGGDDVGSTPAMSQALADAMPNAHCIINPRHKHGAPIQYAEILAHQVLHFLLNSSRS